MLPSIPLSDLLFLSSSDINSSSGNSLPTLIRDQVSNDNDRLQTPPHSSQSPSSSRPTSPIPEATLISYLNSGDATLFGLIGHHADSRGLLSVQVISTQTTGNFESDPYGYNDYGYSIHLQFQSPSCTCTFITHLSILSSAPFSPYVDLQPTPLPSPPSPAPFPPLSRPTSLSSATANCPICLLPLHPPPPASPPCAYTTPCDHTFHLSCMSRWSSSSCPVCRSKPGDPPSRSTPVCPPCPHPTPGADAHQHNKVRGPPTSQGGGQGKKKNTRTHKHSYCRKQSL